MNCYNSSEYYSTIIGRPHYEGISFYKKEAIPIELIHAPGGGATALQSLSSNIQMWLTYDGGKKKIRLPVHPEELNIKDGSQNKSVDIIGLGEIVIKQDRPAVVIDFSSFFPAAYFPGIQVDNITPPQTLVDTITEWKNSDKPVQFIVSGTPINLYCTIESFSHAERGGDIKTQHYSISLKEYREVSARQVKVEDSTAKMAKNTTTRTDNRVTPKTHTVGPGDNLWSLARKYLGDQNRWKDIYELNKNKIKNPSLIIDGWVLQIPEK